ncbi:MAG: polyketide synthase [Polyangiaceae bacterium]
MARHEDQPLTSSEEAPAAQAQTPLQRAVAALAKMKARVESLEKAANDPIAVVGVGCRFPAGGTSPAAYWDALERGVDGVKEIPAERWPRDAIPGSPQETRWAGLLDDVETFDPRFFGMAPREAESLDPQQRLLLEIAWEALEDAGIRPTTLEGSRTGVFVGASGLDYRERVIDQRAGAYDAYCATGNFLSTAAGRVSYVLGLQGPAMVIDTACSSSLVALHTAVASLRARDCDLAIAGGVNLLLSPTSTTLIAATQALSPDGRCRALDARANGFVRSEGCGLVVLKRLSDAERDGDRVIALVLGSAVNQDGRSTGLTAPNVLAQQALLRQAIQSARISPAELTYMEMHGTGTSLGDPIEYEALRAVVGEPRADGSTCVLGAVKTNVGHLESAAGIAGFIKVLQALGTAASRPTCISSASIRASRWRARPSSSPPRPPRGTRRPESHAAPASPRSASAGRTPT